MDQDECIAGIKQFLPNGPNEQDNQQFFQWEKYAENNYTAIVESVPSGDGGMDFNVPFVIRHLTKAGIHQGRFFDAVVAYSRQFMGGEGQQGYYTPAAMTTYNKIKQLTDNEQHVTIGTRAWGNKGKVITGSGAIKTAWFGGVLTVDDLFPSHAYELVGVKEKDDVRFLKLRNPHGSKKMVGSAEFHIELSRAMRHLQSFHFLDRTGQEQKETE